MFSGMRGGSRISSGGSAGISSQDHSPLNASHMCVKTRARSRPPASRTKTAAFSMCAASGGSPARRSAVYASTVVDRSAGPPVNVAHVPSSRCWARIQRAVASVIDSVRMPRNWRSSRSSASMVTLACSSPFHHPSSCCIRNSASTPRSQASCTAGMWSNRSSITAGARRRTRRRGAAGRSLSGRAHRCPAPPAPC